VTDELPVVAAFDEDALEEPFGEEQIHRVLVGEIGEALANVLARERREHERAQLERHPAEGLRERKKRLTRQRISDVATALFVFRGFDNVRVSEVADLVGVSEKTVYNYFPTKESMLFDMADEGVERVTSALRERPPDESPTQAVVRAMIEDLDRQTFTDGVELLLPAFAEMVESTPSLRAAWLDIHSRAVAVMMEELAASAEVDPHEPETIIAARAIASLQDVAYEMLVRHVAEGLRGKELRDAVVADIQRAARLLETGLSSFNLLARSGRTRQQLVEATKAADEARTEVVKALKEAHAAWKQLRRHQHDEIDRATQEVRSAARRASEQDSAQHGREVLKAARKATKSLRQAHAIAEQATKESLRETLRETLRAQAGHRRRPPDAPR
jgi:AcrR family transcriptional regulator